MQDSILEDVIVKPGMDRWDEPSTYNIITK